ncbi:exodeoxyribonuclease V subunit beta [Rhodohalobacter barkolensis]|uniref:DNA 3'-5' helicase n=1 Tax=Rhodohalobacter barkolensis TaxID=2053187 RepID=A0A2N0VKI4_9BACT|nr:exodeoxyribonuclease V subunit beta [Rhodohalobacter barkolensis]PKD44702.1 exodeoxyribonuclease V subunit beta [Rhodohalobacter barkolensis]
MSKKLESIYDLQWDARAIIEANAGTGKTYTIVGLFLRLLLEKELKVDEILVVTFTNKAASELRERILESLRTAKLVLNGEKETIDDFLRELFKRTEDRKDAVKIINQAILNFDDSLISTIHGFCQKVLREEALLAGSSFGAEIFRQDSQLDEATEDFWREYVAENSSTEPGQYNLEILYNLKKVNSDSAHPDTLKKVLNDLFKKPYAEVEGEVMDNVQGYLADVLSLRDKLKRSWDKHRSQILKEFLECDLSHYSERNVTSRIQKMDDFLNFPLYGNEIIDQLKYFKWSYVSDDSNLTSKGTVKPEYCEFFDLVDEYSDLISDIEKVKTTVLLEAYNRINERRINLKKDSETYSYDDLLIKLRDALTVGTNADKLVRKLRKRYSVALVDEFQDTDPIQYKIFDKIYPANSVDSSLLMIGDPKQAIYTFRGADVYAYLKAKNELQGEVYTLQDNYRSSEGVIEGVNALFGFSDYPFLDEQIEYNPSGVGMEHLSQQFLQNGKQVPGIHFTVYEPFQTGKDDLRYYSVHQTVREIGEMLEDSTLQIFDEESEVMRRVKPGDIAILVAKNRDAEKVKHELKKVGLSAVTYSREKVLESFEAIRIKLLMESVLDPESSSKAGNLLVSGFFGFDGDHLYKAGDDESFLTQLFEILNQLNEIWYSHGFYAMIRHLLFKKESLHHFSAQPDSERVLTNLFHLADICAKAEQEHALSMGELYHWFLDEMKQAEDDDEKTQLLESDQKLIKILTVHTSKGLEFPIVFCPFLWEGTRKEKGDEFNEYHDENNRLKINVDFRKDANTEIVQKSILESVSEEVRKTYVAITRAKYQCRIIWGSHTESHLSGMGGIMLGKKFIEEQIDNKLGEKDKQVSTTKFIDIISEVQAQHADFISIKKISEYYQREEPVKLSDEFEAVPDFQPYSGPVKIQPGRRLDSFSSLTSHGGDASQPDYDQTLESYVSFLQDSSEQQRKQSIFTFPKGATAGTAIHKLFEHEDFEFAAANQTNLIPITEEVLDQYNFDKKWSGVLQKMMRDVTGSTIGDLDLSQVKRVDEIREMEFHFPSSDLQLDEILEIIRNSPHSHKNKSRLQNYLTGFIDLTVRQNGKYYILDYKSNYLGDQIEDYAPEKLRREIESVNYDVQYHIYTVALKKYLTTRIPNFDYDRDFGGVAYLFVRGMRADSNNGVWSVKPEKEVIDRLEIYLTSETNQEEMQR